MAPYDDNHHPDDPPVGDLVRDLSAQTRVSVGMFGSAGVVALAALGALTAAGILGLATVMEPWLAALLVGTALAAIAGLLAVLGKEEVERAMPLVSEQTVASTQPDLRFTKDRVEEPRT